MPDYYYYGFGATNNAVSTTSITSLTTNLVPSSLITGWNSLTSTHTLSTPDNRAYGMQGTTAAFIPQVPAAPLWWEMPAAAMQPRAMPPPHRVVISDADKRAKDLLLSCLSETQRELYNQHNYFLVASNRGRIFKLIRQRMHNVFLLDAQQRPLEEWCVTLQGTRIPIEDVLLAQKLMLEHDEDELKRESNVTCLRTRRVLHQAAKQYRPSETPLYEQLVAA